MWNRRRLGSAGSPMTQWCVVLPRDILFHQLQSTGSSGARPFENSATPRHVVACNAHAAARPAGCSAVHANPPRLAELGRHQDATPPASGLDKSRRAPGILTCARAKPPPTSPLSRFQGGSRTSTAHLRGHALLQPARFLGRPWSPSTARVSESGAHRHRLHERQHRDLERYADNWPGSAAGQWPDRRHRKGSR